MPVSAPRLSRHSTLPVIKSEYLQEADLPHKPILHNLSRNVPAPSRSASLAFPVSAREGWSGPMSPFTSNLRPHRIWEDDERENVGFESGLTGAGNASVSKGYRAQAPFPPVFPSLSFGAPTSYERYSDSEPLDDDSGSDVGLHYGNGSDWSYDEDIDMDEDDDDLSSTRAYVSSSILHQSPLVEDYSPVDRDDPASSPGPMTPFGDYVDRAVLLPCVSGGYPFDSAPSHDVYHCGSYCQDCPQNEPLELEAAPPASAPMLTTDMYKKLADPMSEWVAAFVWKLCTGAMEATTGTLLTSTRVPSQGSIPPAHLAASIRSLLLSTLLQPSAVLLAMRFIARLPVQLGPIHLDMEQVDEYRFRVALLGRLDAREREEMESLAPFRLVVLGFMLANKWLDDHTFSNKTWHTISSVPIEWLNNLETLALNVFHWDLSISGDEWSSWLSQIASYHASLSSAPSPYPQPISRPSSTPHAIIRKTIDDIRRVVDAEPCIHGCCDDNMLQPVFLGLEERQRQRDQTWDADVCDIDLDEDGPLREEYLPRRRSSKSGSKRSCRSHDSAGSQQGYERAEAERSLPPPARWSPGADEPLTQRGDRRSAVMMAPGPYAVAMPPPAPAAPRMVPMDARYPVWPAMGYHHDPRYPSHAYNGSYHAPLPPPVYGYEPTPAQVYPYTLVAGHGVSPPQPVWPRPDYHNYQGSFPQAGWTRIVAH